MKYKIADFKIGCTPELTQIAKDLLPDLMGEIGFESFEDTPDGLKGYIPADLMETNSLKQVLDTFPLEGVNITYTLSDTEDKNWNEAWENTGFAPIKIDDKVLVYDARAGRKPAGHSLINIGIEAKQAFGTGTHETTRMMIGAMLQLSLKGKRVLDSGCGTGILGIAALKLGAEAVVGFDIDEWSVENTQHNAAINEVDNIEVFHGDAHVLSHVSGVFDVVLANINRNILLNDMPAYLEIMNAGSVLIISGFYEEDVKLLDEKANSLGLVKTSQKTDNHWCCLTFIKQ
ncbi:ribosomal protein L11 methyltransferase [Hoylesella buccalis ATCC 35310]|uniref:Ribosomal protein L11 methyltransferase n=1 Tax=Hoylesella buccalis ATCC 35310 TaxID=679190 RepID=D1W6Z7_9BACT|nr:50S ribosomal protein L11 methyltransferase [Hoylesella buccalis]EFA91682.1 ribosomal protein L11 methyltransferase [Hoylesella buccalis ATCC 35310]